MPFITHNHLNIFAAGNSTDAVTTETLKYINTMYVTTTKATPRLVEALNNAEPIAVKWEIRKGIADLKE